MNSDHQLESSASEALGSVEQLTDHSELSALYPKQETPWDGTIMTPAERDAARENESAEISTSLRRHFVTIGVLVALPFLLASAVVASVLEVGLLTSDSEESKAILMIMSIVIGGAWLITSFIALRKVVHLFYDHAMRAAPFIAILLVLIGISVQSLFILTYAYHLGKPLMTVGIVGLSALLWSVALSFALLWIWTSTRISDRIKILYISLVALGAVVAASVIGAANLLIG